MSTEFPEFDHPKMPDRRKAQEFVRDLRKVAAEALDWGDFESARREEGIADRITAAIIQGRFTEESGLTDTQFGVGDTMEAEAYGDEPRGEIMIETTQSEARTMAKRLSAETGVIHVADTVRPSNREDRWLRGGWADKTSVWVVINQAENAIAWPRLEKAT